MHNKCTLLNFLNKEGGEIWAYRLASGLDGLAAKSPELQEDLAEAMLSRTPLHALAIFDVLLPLVSDYRRERLAKRMLDHAADIGTEASILNGMSHYAMSKSFLAFLRERRSVMDTDMYSVFLSSIEKVSSPDSRPSPD
jgi:hypothetical protein